MPELTRVLTHDDLRRGDATSRMDLSPYIEILERVRGQGGVGGTLELQEGEKQRTEKRRLSIAAKQLGVKLTWRRPQEDLLRFVLSDPGRGRPGGRTRGTRS